MFHISCSHLVFVLDTNLYTNPPHLLLFVSFYLNSSFNDLPINKLNSQAGQVPPTSHYIPSIMNGRHIPLIMIVHGIQVPPRVRVASLAPQVGVPARAESREAARHGHLAARVGSQAQTIIVMTTQDMMTGYLQVISLNGMPQTVRVGRAIPIVSSGWAL